MRKVSNKKLNFEFLQKKTSPKYGKAKWIIFAESLIAEGYEVYLYEARRTFSKYLTIKKDDLSYKVRFSNHKPILEREKNKDCDFFVGVSNFGVTTTDDAILAVNKFFKERM